MFTTITETKWGRILLPAIMFQSVSIGGGFSTGREVVEYSAMYGSLGVVSILAYFLFLATCGPLIYEFARQFELYDYKSLMSNLIWKLWPIFEIIYILLAVSIIAVIVSASGELMNEILGIPVFIASALLITVVFAVLYFGRETIERFSVVGTTFIYVVYAAMFIFVLVNQGDQAISVLVSGDTRYVGDPAITEVVEAGLIYAGYSLIGFIPPLFILDRMETRSEAVTSGVLSAVMLVIPLVLTYLSLLAYYPDEAVMGAEVPWLEVLSAGSMILLIFYGLAIGWTLVESGVGYTHAIIERMDENIRQSDFSLFAEKDGLSPIQEGAFGTAILLGSVLLSRIGIIALVDQVYPILAVLFGVVLILPLITVGLYRLANPTWKEGFWKSANKQTTSQSTELD